MKKNETLIFLKPFNIQNPTLDEQNGYMMREVANEVECSDMGKIYNNEALCDKDLPACIAEEVKRHRPQWVVAEGECATVALSLKHQKKVLLNPKVSFDDLNNIPEQTRQNTFGFFDNLHEQDYERFLSVYPHAAWFP